MENVRKIMERIAIKIVCLILISIGMVAVIYPIFLNNKEEKQLPVHTEWKVQINNKTYETDHLSQLTFPMTQKGDHVELTTRLPEADFPQVSLFVYEKYAVIHIYVDNVEVYEYGEKYARKNQMVGSGNIWVELPLDYAGKELRIVEEVQENQAFSKLHEIYLQDSNSIYYGLVTKNLLTAMVTGFFLCFGWVTLIITICVYTKGKHLQILFGIAGFSVLVAQWLLCYSHLIEIVTKDFQLIANLEFISLYLAPIFMLFFMYGMLANARYRKTIRGVALLFAACDVILFMLHFMNLAHFSATLSTFQMMALTGGIFVSVMGLKWARQTKKRADRIFADGIVVFVGFVAADIIRYMINKYCNIGFDLSVTLMQVGLLAFVISMTLSFVFMMMERAAENMERKTLIQMAYTDALTNIKNRASCEEVFQRYDLSKEPLTIINMDLNGFKEINDAYGHAVGDELLMRFANILENTFSDKGFVGRMGGDEFIVILDYRPKEEVEDYLRELLMRVGKANAGANRPYKISVSYGYADNYGKPYMSAWKVYEIADHHMYEYKKQFKEKGGV